MFLALLVLTALGHPQEECTTAVISGAASDDGRPLLWKNRDSSFRENSVVRFCGPHYDFIGVINSGDTTQVWMGLNTAGFAIMNSESMDQEGDSADCEGYFMKQALGLCGSVDEFESLLKSTNHPNRGTRANFGCIDASDGAAFFEAGNHTFTRLDARDTTLQKQGFLVRANFSMTGQGPEGYGSWRYHRARRLLTGLVATGSLNYRSLFDLVVRDLVSDELDPYPLPYRGSWDGAAAGLIRAQNTINRHSTVACAVFHGVKKGENPTLATMWITLGQPVASIALPLWPRAGSPSEIWRGEGGSALNRQFLRIRDQMYPDRERKQYLDTRQLKPKSAWVEKRNRLEERVFSQSEEAMKSWRNKQPSAEELARLQTRLSRDVFQELRKDAQPEKMKKF